MYVLFVMKYGYLNYARIQMNSEMVCYIALQSIMYMEVLVLWYLGKHTV